MSQAVKYAREGCQYLDNGTNDQARAI